jgi:hypothetical protein
MLIRRPYGVRAAIPDSQGKARGQMVPAGLKRSWLRMLDTHRTGSVAPWWQAFPVYKEHQDRRTIFRWGQFPPRHARIYTSPPQDGVLAWFPISPHFYDQIN